MCSSQELKHLSYEHNSNAISFPPFSIYRLWFTIT